MHNMKCNRHTATCCYCLCRAMLGISAGGTDQELRVGGPGGNGQQTWRRSSCSVARMRASSRRSLSAFSRAGSSTVATLRTLLTLVCRRSTASRSRWWNRDLRLAGRNASFCLMCPIPCEHAQRRLAFLCPAAHMIGSRSWHLKAGKPASAVCAPSPANSQVHTSLASLLPSALLWQSLWHRLATL